MSEPYDFLREAFDEREEGEPVFSAIKAHEVLAALRHRVSEFSLSPASDWSRLKQRVSQLPERYAPFFDDLSEMFGCTEAQLYSELSRARDAKLWRRTPFAGVRFYPLSLSRKGGDSLLVRLDEGAKIPRHSHPAGELTLVLEGGYRDDRGLEKHAGDFDRAEKGHSHALSALQGGPCVAALHLDERFVFESPVARALLSLFWRKERREKGSPRPLRKPIGTPPSQS